MKPHLLAFPITNIVIPYTFPLPKIGYVFDFFDRDIIVVR